MLSGKVAIVTGGSRGIGLAITLKFIKAGATVITCSRHKSPDLENAEKEFGGKLHAAICDVTNQVDIERVVSEVLERCGSVDILANIAGISPKAPGGMKIPFFEQRTDQWRDVIETNLNSVFYFSRAVVHSMMRQNYGRIINMSSIVGLTSSEHGPASSAYVTSKTGVIGLTRAMAYDLAPYGITVNAIAPGRILTPMSAANHPSYDELHTKLIPMHRFGMPEEVAELALFYASEKSAYITGEVTNITGGWYI